MMKKTLLLYSSTDGHTIKICEKIQSVLFENKHQPTLLPLPQARTVNLNDFDLIILGASIRYGKHKPEVFDFISQNQSLLEQKKTAFFSVNLVARKPEKNTPETNPYMIKFLSQISWQPDALSVFAGKIDYKKYKLTDRIMILFIMWLTKGPTHPKACVDFTDWARVDAFGKELNHL